MTLNKIVAGIDVGGPSKGHHLVIKELNGDNVLYLHFKDVLDCFQILNPYYENNRLLAIAIDAPQKSFRKTLEARPAEKELVTAGYRLFWTPGKDQKSPSWMREGEKIWNELKKFRDVSIIEAFPSASSDFLYKVETGVKLNSFSGKYNNKIRNDFLDASICAETAQAFLNNKTRIFGKDDLIGPIHILDCPRKKYVLALIVHENKVLLGHKKTGLGKGKWNGFGGKVEPFDSSLESAMLREVKEECALIINHYQKVGHLFFNIRTLDEILDVSVFLCDDFEGTPIETIEMFPKWFHMSDIPYDNMWLDDPYWLPFALKARKFKAFFEFSQESRLTTSHISLV